MYLDRNNNYKNSLLIQLNKTIKNIYIDKYKQDHLYFKTEGYIILWEAVGDCCSEAWFADIIGMPFFLKNDSRIYAIEQLCFGNYVPKDHSSRQDVDTIYGYQLKKPYGDGNLTVIFRNSSNGHYGGEIEETVIDKLPDNIIEIINDWSA